MGEERPAALLDVDGPAAPPRRNGELAFEAPWESRLFGLTMSLRRAGLFAWDDFRERLIAEIAAWEAAPRPPGEWSYWRSWQRALETLLVARGVCAATDLERHMRALAARAPGHDHDRL